MEITQMTDLSLGTFGVFKCRNGETFHTFVEPNKDGTYSVRYEHGWWVDYERDGKRRGAGRIIHRDGGSTLVGLDCNDRDIVSFVPCKVGDACTEGIQNGLHP